MKQCPNCGETFSDEYKFCLSDGMPLNDAPGRDAFRINVEAPTEILSQTTATQVRSPQTSHAQAFPEKKKSSAGMLIGIFIAALLLVGVAIAAIGGYFFISNRNNQTAVAGNANSKENKAAISPSPSSMPSPNVEPSPTSTLDNDPAKKKLEEEKAKLEAEKKKLDEEKKKLGQNNNSSSDTKPAGVVRAIVLDPPTNIRVRPNGEVQCVINKSDYIGILDREAVRDSKGDKWYYTNACGKIGLVHQSQIEF